MKKLEKNYKFKDIKAYGSTDWLNGGKKKYRRVFENAETTYIYCELNFYNKLFDEEDWKCKVTLKAYQLHKDKKKDKELLCELKSDKEVTMDENIVVIRDGWGNADPGEYWTAGEYEWEAWIDDDLVGTEKFWIEKVGLVTEEENPYFEIDSIRLYEGPSAGTAKDKRVYYKKFASADTRYLYVEFNIRSKIEHDWQTELIFNYYNDSNQHFGSTTELKKVAGKKGEITSVVSGWGSSGGGSWNKDKYTAEIIFMDQLIATVPFVVEEEFEEGETPYYTAQQVEFGATPEASALKTHQQRQEQDLNELLEDMDSMIGLNEIKTKLHEFTQYIKFLQLRQEKGLDQDERINLKHGFCW